jgi:hypothetical protein
MEQNMPDLDSYSQLCLQKFSKAAELSILARDALFQERSDQFKQAIKEDARALIRLIMV